MSIRQAAQRPASASVPASHKWEFAPRFRRNAFGWKSDTPMQRIKEALAEIKAVAKKEPVLTAEGAVLFLEKLAPAINEVDSSSGAIGNAVNRAIETLVPLVAKAELSESTRDKLLERLWTTLQEDRMPYIEYLGEFWGTLCASPALSSKWADALSPALLESWSRPRDEDYRYFKGTAPCLSALYAAGRHDELLALLAKAPFKFWDERIWGAKALLAAGKHTEAVCYAEASRSFNAPSAAIGLFCEGALLASGDAEQAYARYAVEAAYASTNAAMYKAIVKKYPDVARERIVRDLVASQPGQEGKWFAAAKDAGLFELAIELANRSPSDPRTLTRAARDFAQEQPAFALAAAQTALRGIANGWGYEITSVDVLDAYAALMTACAAAGVAPAQVHAELRAMIAASGKGGAYVGKMLQVELKA